MRKLLILAILMVAAPCWAQRTDSNCGPTSATQGSFTLVPNTNGGTQYCKGQTADTAQSSTETLTYNIVAGGLIIGILGSCDTESVTGGCSGGPYTASNLNLTDNDGMYANGTVTVASDGTMTLTGGLGWGMQGCNWGGCKWSSQTITVAGSSCTMTKPLTMWMAQTSGCTVGTGETFKGPAGLPACTDTGDAPGEQLAWCVAIAASNDTADTFTASGAATNPPHSLEFTVWEQTDTGNNFSIDYAYCSLANCGAWFEYLGTNPNTSTNQLQFEGQGTTSASNEMVVFIGGYQSVGSTPTSGWQAMMTGAASPVGNACVTGNCTNQVQSELATFATAQTVNPVFNSSSANNEALLMSFAIVPTATAYTPSQANWQLRNWGMGKVSATQFWGTNYPQTTFGMPLTNPSCVKVCVGYFGTAPGTGPTVSGLTFTDSGPGAVAQSGGHEQCWLAPNTGNARQVFPTWTTNGAGMWVEYEEWAGTSSNSCTKDGGSGVGYASHANASSGASGSTTSGSVTTVTNNDLILSTFVYGTGPAGNPGSSFVWDYPLSAFLKIGSTSYYGTAPNTQYRVLGTAGTLNPGATDQNGSNNPASGTSGDTYSGITIALKPAATATVVRHRAWVKQ